MDAPQALLLCPRCDYDLSGVPASWRDACPMEGRCSECGLIVSWRELHRPELVAPLWSFEHARVRRFRSFWITARKALWPRRVWVDMKLSAPIRARRVVLFALILILLTHASIATMWGAQAGYWQWRVQYVLRVNTAIQAARGIPVATPATPAVPLWITEGLKTAAMPYWEGQGPSALPRVTWWLIVFGAAMPLPFLVLTQSFARVKCRKAHLARGAAMFMPALCVIAITTVLARVVEPLLDIASFSAEGRWFIMLAVGCFVIGVLVYFVWWWWQFTRNYLKLEHALAVVAAMWVVAGLLGAAVVVYV